MLCSFIWCFHPSIKASGEIDIMYVKLYHIIDIMKLALWNYILFRESRGNRRLYNPQGVNIGSEQISYTLHYGPYWPVSCIFHYGNIFQCIMNVYFHEFSIMDMKKLILKANLPWIMDTTELSMYMASNGLIVSYLPWI